MMLASILLLTATLDAGQHDPGPNPLLMRNPAASETRIVFQFAGDLWWVPRDGGAAARLTSAPGTESLPHFSPDGSTVAFSGQYDGNMDVFVVPAQGGVPKRLTAHPANDRVMGWTPDGSSVLFSSRMVSEAYYSRMFTVPAIGGSPVALPFPSGTQASLSPDSSQIAYVPRGRAQQAWKRYRGGQTTPIWIARLSDSKWKRIPRENTSDHHPMWVGDYVYYISDPDGPMGLNRYDTRSGRTETVIKGSGFDIKSASAAPGAIVYEKFGSIHIYDLARKRSSRVPITIASDFPEVRKQFKDVSGRVGGTSLSPTGKRLVVSARGWIFTVPAEKGDARLVDDAQGINRRDPAWSPDGKTIAYITDQSGFQELALYDAAASTTKLFGLGGSPGYYDDPHWSPDSKKVAYTDEKRSLWVLDVASGTNTKIDSVIYRGRARIEPQWSPDSKWLTWARDLDSHFNAVFLHNLESGLTTQVTDGMAHTDAPVFDRDGKHLYFLASTDVGQGIDSQDISSFNSPNATSTVYGIVLAKDGPNPLHPESDEEKVEDDEKEEKEEKDEKEEKEEKDVVIDLEGIEERIFALPLPRKMYTAIDAGPKGTVFVLSRAPGPTILDASGPGVLEKFSFSDRKTVQFASPVRRFTFNADGSKIVLTQGRSVRIVATASPPSAGKGTVNMSGLSVRIDPVAEWKAMFDEVWRNEKLLFYDPDLHGVDAAKMAERYRPFLANVRSRDDLNYLFADMLGEISVGHMYVRGGDMPPGHTRVPGGLLGADFELVDGRYKIARIYSGERWNPNLYAPLAQPGIQAKAGEYLLSIDGKELTDAIDIYVALENKARRQVRVRLGPNPDGTDSREVTVVPVPSEESLRLMAWIEGNRRRVDEMTGGRAGYVWVPDTSLGGWRAFQRYFYAQSDKDAMVIDERFNGGGFFNDFMVRELTKPLDFFSATRYGKNWKIPPTGVFGPKVMLINEAAGSGGDIFPFMFRQHGVGKLVGKRTWGGMMVNAGFRLIDGGRVSAPDDAVISIKTGDWVIENWGTAPDIDVELDPFQWRKGFDSQLEAAIEQLNKELAEYKPLQPKTPAAPVRTKAGGG